MQVYGITVVLPAGNVWVAPPVTTQVSVDSPAMSSATVPVTSNVFGLVTLIAPVTFQFVSTGALLVTSTL